jgi:hypothetical protein
MKIAFNVPSRCYNDMSLRIVSWFTLSEGGVTDSFVRIKYRRENFPERIIAR